jgi:hypothetical protein
MDKILKNNGNPKTWANYQKIMGVKKVYSKKNKNLKMKIRNAKVEKIFSCHRDNLSLKNLTKPTPKLNEKPSRKSCFSKRPQSENIFTLE